MDSYLILYKDCVNIKGYKNHLICDLTRNLNSNYIPDSLSSFLDDCKENPIGKVLNNLSEIDKLIAQEYVDFILKKEFGFIGDSFMKNSLIDFDFNFETPELIENIILEINDFNVSLLEKTLSFFELTLCSAIELRINKITTLELDELIGLFNNSIIESIYIHVNNNQFKESFLSSLKDRFKRVKRITVYDMDIAFSSEEIFHENLSLNDYYLNSYKNRVFIESQDFYIETIRNNAYFNKKLYVGPDGKIKNAPECVEHHGYIHDLDHFKEFREIIESKEFQKYWYVNKDRCDVCRDCEYRHMCVDNRLPTQRKDGSWYYLQECNYNPYIGKWEEETSYKSLKECGISCDEEGFEIDDKIIAGINLEIWEE